MLTYAKQRHAVNQPSPGKVNFLLYMDDLKLYEKNINELEPLVKMVGVSHKTLG